MRTSFSSTCVGRCRAGWCGAATHNTKRRGSRFTWKWLVPNQACVPFFSMGCKQTGQVRGV